MTGYLSNVEAQAFRAMQNLGLFWRLSLPVTSDGDLTLRLWMGINDYPVRPETIDTPFTGMESIDSVGDIYNGAGKLINIPELEVLVNGLADGVEFSLSGVPTGVVRLLDETGPVVKGREVHVGIAPLDAYWQPVIPIKPLWLGIADFWSAQSKATRDVSKPATSTITLSVGSGTTGRARPRRVSFTDSQQKLRFPTDQFFSRGTRYTQTYLVKWPDF